MHIGLVGLGKMGARMRARLEANGIEVTGYDTNPDVSDVATLDDLAAALPTPRLVWVMVPAGKVTQNVVGDLARILEPGDLVIDGGNSKFTDDFAHAGLLAEKGIDFVDAGVSGGVWGLENGYGLMVGGPVEQVQRAMPVFDALRPEGPREEGFVHVGDSGAGHYAKMVHNGIEYAMMQSFAEGYELLAARKDIIKDVTGTFEAWQAGRSSAPGCSSSWSRPSRRTRASRTSRASCRTPASRWTIEEALDNAVPMPAISASIFARFSSRQEDSPAMKAVAALRNQFGGHSVQKKS